MFSCIISVQIYRIKTFPAMPSDVFLHTAGGRPVFRRFPPVFQLTAFRLPKGRLSGAKRRPFTRRKAVFCKASCGVSHCDRHLAALTHWLSDCCACRRVVLAPLSCRAQGVTVCQPNVFFTLIFWPSRFFALTLTLQ